MRIRKHAKIPFGITVFANSTNRHGISSLSPMKTHHYFSHRCHILFVGFVDNETFNDTNETIASVVEDVDVNVSFDAKKINQDKYDDTKMKELGLSMDKNNNGNKKQEKEHDVVVAKTGRFGPLWGKKRGASKKTIHPATSITGNNSTKNAEQCLSSQMDNEEIKYVELEDEDDHHEEQNGKKKRSLEAN